MSKDTGPPGHPPAVTTCIEFYGARPITIRDSEVAADFIIDHFHSISAVHTAPMRKLPQTASSGPTTEVASDG